MADVQKQAVKFYFCTLEKYNAATKEDNALYFITDAKRIYKGSNLYGGSFEVVTTLPSIGVHNTLYYHNGTGEGAGAAWMYENGEWVTKFLPFETLLTQSETKVPTSKAVYDVLGIDGTQAASTGPILENNDGQIRLNDNYNPGINLLFNGKPIDSNVININFAGTTTLIPGEDGTLKVQIGDNMNSSVWGTKDGAVGDGTPVSGKSESSNMTSSTNIHGTMYVTDYSGASSEDFINMGNWAVNSSQNCILSSSTTTVCVASKDVIHFNEGDNLWEVTVTGWVKTSEGKVEEKTLVSALITDTVTYNNENNPTSATVTAGAVSYAIGDGGVSHTIYSGNLEKNYPKAVGGRGKVAFKINMNSIPEIKNGGRFKFEIKGCGGSYKSAELFYMTGVTPKIDGDVSLTMVNTSLKTKTISGVKYISDATLNLNVADIKNLNNQGASANKLNLTPSGVKLKRTSVPSGNLSGYTTAWDDVCSYSDNEITLASNQNLSGTALKVTCSATNAFGTCTAISSNNVIGYNINTHSPTASTNSVEYFGNDEAETRLTSNLGAWDSTAVLGGDDLQIIPGVGLVYPTVNYSGIPTPSNNPDYSKTSKVCYYYRKMISGSGTKFGGTLTLAGLGSNFSDSDFDARLSIDGGSTWFNLKADRGGADATGILNSYTSSSDAISFSFPGTTSMTASDGVIIKLGWSAKDTKITKITLAM